MEDMEDTVAGVTYRLPPTVRPERYTIEIAPDLSQGTFTGMETVELIISAPVREIVMNGDGLHVSAEPLQPDMLGQEPVVSYRPEEERVVLTFDRDIPPGKFRLTLRFDGRLAEDLRGFYRTVVTDPAGRESVIASTQCEPTDARRVFPCWDEPAFKASFAITLVIDPALEAYSNGREIRNVIDPASGKRRVTFAETVPLSTYVVALAVGHFQAGEPATSSGTPVRIIARPHMARLTTFARDEAVRHLQFFEDYFGIPYPGEKLDHIAIPDFAAGAMENLGLVTYREEALLVDAKAASPRELIGISEVIAHETAHMWFGDLVTMRWWNGIWLNEAFATFMSTLAVNALHPDWDIWSIFARGRADALSVDSLASTRPIEYPVGRPEEAEGMFDVLTYEKGGAILRMLEQYLTPPVFRDGIQRYLKRHRLGNTETGDLWDALEDVSGVPVRSMMDGWVFTGGYPLITVRQDNPTTLHLSARQFRYQGEGSASWTTPVLVGVHLADGTVQQIPVLVSRDPVPLQVPSGFRFLTANAGGYGFYRVAYDDKLFARLRANLGALSPIERLGVVDDVWAAVVAGKVPLRQAVALWTHLGKEADPDVVATVSQQMDLLAHVTDDAGREALSRFIQAVVGPRLKALGWEPSRNEDIRTSRLRATLITLLGMSGNDPDVQAEARRRLYRHLDHGAQVAPEILNAAASIVAYVGGSSDVERIRQAYEEARTPQEETRYLYALAHTRTPESVEAVLGFYLSDAVKIQDSAYALGELLENRYARGKAWEAVETHWATFLKKYPRPMLQAFYSPIGQVVEANLADRMMAFVDAHPIPEIARQTEQAKEFQGIHRAFHERISTAVREALEAHMP